MRLAVSGDEGMVLPKLISVLDRVLELSLNPRFVLLELVSSISRADERSLKLISGRGRAVQVGFLFVLSINVIVKVILKPYMEPSLDRIISQECNTVLCLIISNRVEGSDATFVLFPSLSDDLL